MMCNVCSDLRRFNVVLNDARRIRANLERLVPHTAVDTSLTLGGRLKAQLTESKGAHFMCGYCMKANTNELFRENEEITDLVLKFLAFAKTNYSADPEKCEKIFHEILRNLRGNYPKIAYNLEQYWFSSVKKPDLMK